MQLKFEWGPARQAFSIGEERFEAVGSISTDPSHDLAHLLIAASGGRLPYLPVGDREVVSFAEYNASLLEHILHRTFCHVRSGGSDQSGILPAAVKHVRWFVETHYAPFPISAEEAYRRFCVRLDPAPVVRLSPYYYRQKRFEAKNADFRSRHYHLEFASEDQPAADATERAFGDVLRQQLDALRT